MLPPTTEGASPHTRGASKTKDASAQTRVVPHNQECIPTDEGASPHNQGFFPSDDGASPQSSVLLHVRGCFPLNEGCSPQTRVLPPQPRVLSHRRGCFPSHPMVLSHRRRSFPHNQGCFPTYEGAPHRRVCPYNQRCFPQMKTRVPPRGMCLPPKPSVLPHTRVPRPIQLRVLPPDEGASLHNYTTEGASPVECASLHN